MVVKGCSRFVEDKLLSCQCPLAGILCVCSGCLRKIFLTASFTYLMREWFSFCDESSISRGIHMLLWGNAVASDSMTDKYSGLPLLLLAC